MGPVNPDTLKAGRELDVLIAEKIMGWPADDWRRIPSYSTSISDAWLVVEKMTERAFTGFAITVSRSEHFVGATAVFMPVTRAGSETELRYGEQPVQARADTAPLAICKAALAAAGGVGL